MQGVRDAAVELLHTLVAVHAEVCATPNDCLKSQFSKLLLVDVSC